MDANILPLGGKYYGTRIEITSGLLKGNIINVWFASGQPSDRELASWGHTRAEWDTNACVDVGEGVLCPIRQYGYIGDSHYECQETYKVALAIVDALKKL